MPFPKALTQNEIQLASSKIWILIAVFISYDDNHYAMGTSCVYVKMYWYYYISVFVCIVHAFIEIMFVHFLDTKQNRKSW